MRTGSMVGRVCPNAVVAAKLKTSIAAIRKFGTSERSKPTTPLRDALTVGGAGNAQTVSRPNPLQPQHVRKERRYSISLLLYANGVHLVQMVFVEAPREAGPEDNNRNGANSS